jgi:membrane protein YqaA with SNARE-associated domain
MTALAAYGGMFLSAFLAATILPFQSEVVLVGLQLDGWPWGWLVLVATVGNVLGAVVNWLLGRAVERFKDRKWFPVDARAYERAEAWYRRWGIWSLLLAWTPWLGDPLTVVAGVLRAPLGPFLVLVTLGKAARYVLLAVGVAYFGWSAP